MAAAMIHANEHVANELAGDDCYPGPYDLFDVPDGSEVTVASDPCGPAFHDFCEAMERPDLATDPRFTDTVARAAHRPELHAIVQDWVSTFPDGDALEAALAGVRIPVGVVRRLSEIADTDWARHREVFVDVADGSGGTITIPSPPWKLSATPAGVAGDPAWRGQHNRQVLARWGVEAGEINRLEAAGVLSARPPRR
jgi:CoA:oxalate CoA-transferase